MKSVRDFGNELKVFHQNMCLFMQRWCSGRCTWIGVGTIVLRGFYFYFYMRNRKNICSC